MVTKKTKMRLVVAQEGCILSYGRVRTKLDPRDAPNDMAIAVVNKWTAVPRLARVYSHKSRR